MPHRSPDLAALLEAAKTCELAPLRRCLAAGGHPDTLVQKSSANGVTFSAPLLSRAMTRAPTLPDYKACIELLLNAGANVDAIIMDGVEEGPSCPC